MPNKKAKSRKQERAKKNSYLKKYGRTSKQRARKKRGKQMATAPTYCTHRQLKDVFPQVDSFDNKRALYGW